MTSWKEYLEKDKGKLNASQHEIDLSGKIPRRNFQIFIINVFLTFWPFTFTYTKILSILSIFHGMKSKRKVFLVFDFFLLLPFLSFVQSINSNTLPHSLPLHTPTYPHFTPLSLSACMHKRNEKGFFILFFFV